MSIRKGIVVSVVAGTILMVVPKPDTWLASLSHGINSIQKWLFDLLFSENSLFGWQWLLISPFIIVGSVVIVCKLFQSKAVPEYYEYNEDVIRNAKWRWSWNNDQIRNLESFCPLCDCSLVYAESDMRSHMYGRPYTKLFCESCNDNEVTSIEGGDRHYAYSLIEREIGRRVRTKAFKKY